MIRTAFLVLAVGILVCSYALAAESSASNQTPTILYLSETDVRRVGGTSGIYTSDDIWPAFYLSNQPRNPPVGVLATVFEGVRLDSRVDVGRTIIATADSDPGFEEFVKLLTDGKQQWLTLPVRLNGPNSASECRFFHGDDSCSAGIDLRGFAVDRITYTIKDWYFETPGRDPNRNGFWTDEYFGYRLTIEGHAIPEPTTATVLAVSSALALIAGRHRSRASKRSKTLDQSGQVGR